MWLSRAVRRRAAVSLTSRPSAGQGACPEPAPAQDGHGGSAVLQPADVAEPWGEAEPIPAPGAELAGAEPVAVGEKDQGRVAVATAATAVTDGGHEPVLIDYGSREEQHSVVLAPPVWWSSAQEVLPWQQQPTPRAQPSRFWRYR